MGVLPVEFMNGDNRHTYKIDGSETFDLIGTPESDNQLSLIIQRTDGTSVDVPVHCRLDTAEEVSIYQAGGVLQRFAQDFLESNT